MVENMLIKKSNETSFIKGNSYRGFDRIKFSTVSLSPCSIILRNFTNSWLVGPRNDDGFSPTGDAEKISIEESNEFH